MSGLLLPLVAHQGPTVPQLVSTLCLTLPPYLPAAGLAPAHEGPTVPQLVSKRVLELLGYLCRWVGGRSLLF